MSETELARGFWRFWLGGLLMLAIMIAMNPWLSNVVSPAGILDHQSATTAIRVNAIQAAWQAAGVMNLARFAMAMDLIYIGIYSYGVYCGGRLFIQSAQKLLPGLGWITVGVAVILGVADYTETLCEFFQAITLSGSDFLAGIAAAAQPIKSTAFLASLLCLLVGLALRRVTRRGI